MGCDDALPVRVSERGVAKKVRPHSANPFGSWVNSLHLEDSFGWGGKLLATEAGQMAVMEICESDATQREWWEGRKLGIQSPPRGLSILIERSSARAKCVSKLHFLIPVSNWPFILSPTWASWLDLNWFGDHTQWFSVDTVGSVLRSGRAEGPNCGMEDSNLGYPHARKAP